MFTKLLKDGPLASNVGKCSAQAEATPRVWVPAGGHQRSSGCRGRGHPTATSQFYLLQLQYLTPALFFFYICSPCPVMCLSVSFKHYLPLEHKQFIAREPLYAKHGLRAIFHPLTYVNTIYSQEAQRAVPAPGPAKLCTHNLTENLKKWGKARCKISSRYKSGGTPPHHQGTSQSDARCAPQATHPKALSDFLQVPNSSEKAFFWGRNVRLWQNGYGFLLCGTVLSQSGGACQEESG